MTLIAVKEKIAHARKVNEDWEKIGEYWDNIKWREDHTRYAIIDPILRALGWKTEDPMECQPECYGADNGGRVDYALYRDVELKTFFNTKQFPRPDIIIEAKALKVPLSDATHVPKLQSYVNSLRVISGGVAVLTNGADWWIYEIRGRRWLKNSKVCSVNIHEDDPNLCAKILVKYIGR